MTKVARLPDGEILRFPDETPDEAIDATVAARIQRKGQQTQQRQQQESQTQVQEQDQRSVEDRNTDKMLSGRQQIHGESMDYRRQRDNFSDQRKFQWRNEDQQVATARHFQNMQGQQNVTRFLGAILLSIGELNKNISRIADGLDGNAMQEVTRTFSEGADKIANALMAPKSLTFDPRGKPTGIKRGAPGGSDKSTVN